MSFLKSLVNKPLPKSEEEVKSDAGDKKKANGGLRKPSSKKEKGRGPVQQAAKSEVTGQKKSESPKGGTLGRLFRSKAKKEEQTSGDKIPAAVHEGKSTKEDTPRPRLFWRKAAVEHPAVVVVVSPNAEPSAPVLAVEAEKEPMVADKSPANGGTPVKSAESWPVPFWKKASAESSPQPSKAESGAKPGGAAADSKSQEGKNAKPKIMMFFKQLTLDITDGVEIGKSEKTVTAVVEPPPPPPLKMKDNPKDKKGSSEKLSKQESRESAEAAASSQVQAPEAAPVLNGSEPSKDGQLKRTDKRQSLGSFFKAIGPKRLCDAEVQTDPVSILPAEKAK